MVVASILTKERLKNICVVAVEEAAKRAKIEIIDMEVDIDHVHVIAEIPMTMDPTKALQLFKGFSARVVFQLVPNLRKLYPRGHLWSPGKFAASVGHITLEKAKNYLETHHAKALLPKLGIPAPERSGGVARRQPFRAGRTSTS